VSRIERSLTLTLTEPEFIQHIPPTPPDADPDHHLWRNGRLWWIAFTVHRGHQQERVRFSLQTPDVAVARRRRDEFLALFAQAEDLQISIRFAPRRARRNRRNRGNRKAA
jgi:hypothetical protein